MKQKGIKCGRTKTIPFSFVLPLLIVSGILICLVVCFGYVFINPNVEVVNSKGEQTVYIATADGFVKAIVMNSLNEGENTTITLIADIELEEEHVEALRTVQNTMGSTGAVLYCTLDGLGYSVVINPSVSAPLFECVYGAIKRTNFEFEEVKSKDEKGDLCALTRVNHGKIEDVKLVVHYLVNAGEKNVGGITNYNFGTISHCVVNLRSIEGNADIPWESRFGGIATNNLEEGEVTGAIVRVSFPSYYFTPLTTNLCVGYAFSSWSDTSKIENVFVVADEKVLKHSCDFGRVTAKEKTNINLDWAGWIFNSVDETTSIDRCLPYLKN